MLDWNAIATTYSGRYNRAASLLRRHAWVERSGFYNVLLLRAPDPVDLLMDLEAEAAREPDITATISHVVPVTHTFSFESAGDLEEHAREVVREWLPRLAGRKFHVRMHRRGLKGEILRMEIERWLDELVLQELDARGTPGGISFEDPDALISVETVRQTCGLACWDRDELARYPLLGRAFHLHGTPAPLGGEASVGPAGAA